MTTQKTATIAMAVGAIWLGVLWSPIPKQIGFYQWLCNRSGLLGPEFVGILPCTFVSERNWEYTFEELYNGTGNIREYKNRLVGERALVTGANSGAGYEVSLALARLGVSVTMACRNATKCQQAATRIQQDPQVVARRQEEEEEEEEEEQAIVRTMTVDLSSLSSVQQFCKQFLIETDDGQGTGNPLPLDMLFLNAGIGHQPYDDRKKKNDSSSELPLLAPVTDDGIEKVYATNVVGHHLMYRLLEPALKAKRNINAHQTTLSSAPSRIVVTSSSMSYYCDGHNFYHPKTIVTNLETLNSIPIDDGTSYSHSKLSQIYWVKELTDRLASEAAAAVEKEEGTNEKTTEKIMYANAANIGLVDSNIWNNMSTKHNMFIMRWMRRNDMFWTPEEGALTLLYLGTATSELEQHDVRGQYYHPQSIRMTNHSYVPETTEQHKQATKKLQISMWNFLDELVQDYIN